MIFVHLKHQKQCESILSMAELNTVTQVTQIFRYLIHAIIVFEINIELMLVRCRGKYSYDFSPFETIKTVCTNPLNGRVKYSNQVTQIFRYLIHAINVFEINLELRLVPCRRIYNFDFSPFETIKTVCTNPLNGRVKYSNTGDSDF